MHIFFAWMAIDMPNIDLSFLCYKLAIYPKTKPVAQKKRRLGRDMRKTAIRFLNAKLSQFKKYVGATYQQLMDKVFVKTLIRNKWRYT
ncbi:hypothetical protein CR513_48967, partial [Mucuna pruriens]